MPDGPFGRLEELIGRVGALAPPVPLSAAEFASPEILGDREHGARARLWRLGYLPTWDGDLSAALLDFQREAGVTEDGWLGPESWQRLRALTTLDRTVLWTDWSRDGEALPALRRGAHLRLRMLGFLPKGPFASPPEAFEPALARFGEASRALEVFGDVWEVLFDHRRLFAALERWKGLGQDQGPTGTMARRLVQWELAQAGHEVPDAGDEMHWDLGGPIEAFWDGLDAVKKPAGKLRRRLTPELIRALRADDEEPPPDAGLDVDGLVHVIEAHAERVTAAVEAQRKRGFFFWESAGRSLRWLWNRARRAAASVIEGAKKLLANTATAIVHAARWVASRAGEGISAMRRALGGLAASFAPIELPGRAVVRGPPWGDRLVWLADPADRATAQACARELAGRNMSLQVVFDVLGRAIAIAARVMAGPPGWLAAALAVARLWESMRGHVDDERLWRPGDAA